MKICVWTTFEKQNLHILYDENGSGILCNDVRLTITKNQLQQQQQKQQQQQQQQQKQQNKNKTTKTRTTMVVKVLDGQRCMCLANEG